MNLRSIHRRLPLTYAGIALLATLALGGVLLFTLRGYYAELERRHLQGNADGITAAIAQLLQAEAPRFVIMDQVHSWAFFLQARVQLFDAEGRPLVDSGPPEMRRVLTVSNPPGGDVFIPGAPPPSEIVVSETDPPTGGNRAWQMYILPSKEQPGQTFFAGTTNCNPGDPEAAEAQCGPMIVKILGRNAAGGGTEVAAGDNVTSTMAVAARPVGMVMPFRSSLLGFTVEMEEDTIERSSQRVEQPVLDDAGNRLGSMLLSDGPAYGQEILNSVARGWLFSGLAAVLVAGLVGWRVSRNITDPLRALAGATGRMASGDLTARAAVLTDDEFGDLGRSFNEMAGRVEDTVQTLRNFVGDAAHQLHTPLTALNTYLDLARDEMDPARKTGYLSSAGDQIERLEAVINGLLELSRLDDRPAVHTAFDLRTVAGELAELFASRAEQAGAQFNYNAPDEAVIVNGDAQQLREAIFNLLDNAFKFMPPGGEVWLRLESDVDRVVISVTDSGIGFSVEDLPRLFGRFYRGRNAAAYPGSGLGLAIVRSIADVHGGEVTAENLDPGARFVLRLPQHL